MNSPISSINSPTNDFGETFVLTPRGLQINGTPTFAEWAAYGIGNVIPMWYNCSNQNTPRDVQPSRGSSIWSYASMSPHDTPIQLKLPLDNVIEIPLTQGQLTIVDAIDADLARVKWCALFQHSYAGGGKFTAARNTPTINGKRTTEMMHRVILSRKLGRSLLHSELVDHIDGNPLNNCRDNLRIATHSQNLMNKGKQSTNTSGYKGVSWHKGARKWAAQIIVNGKRLYIGEFKTPEEAHVAYCEAAKELHGEFANFGDTP